MHDLHARQSTPYVPVHDAFAITQKATLSLSLLRAVPFLVYGVHSAKPTVLLGAAMCNPCAMCT